jgi:ribosomal protein S1
MAKDRVEHPEDVVSAGQEVFVKVLTVDPPDNSRGRAKISLSMKYADQVSEGVME